MGEYGMLINGETSPIIAKQDGSPFGKFAYCGLILIEPAFLVHQMTYWAFVPLNDQFIVSYVSDHVSLAFADDNATSYNTTFFEASTVSQQDQAAGNASLQQDAIHETDAIPLDLDNQIQEEATRWVLILTLVTDILAIFSTLIICSYTDVIGRKIGIILPLLGYLGRMVVYIITMYLDLPIQYLFIGAIVDGLCGSTPTITGSSFAYLTDITTAESRTFR